MVGFVLSRVDADSALTLQADRNRAVKRRLLGCFITQLSEPFPAATECKLLGCLNGFSGLREMDFCLVCAQDLHWLQVFLGP